MKSVSVQDRPVKVLLVDDNPANLLAHRHILEDLGLEMVEASSGNQALKYLLEEDFAVVLMDVVMPMMSGFEIAKLLRSREKTKYLPIIFVTALSTDEASMFRGYSSGAVDYITTPIVPEILRAKVCVFVDLYRKTEEIRRQTEVVKELERKQLQKELDSQKQLHQIESLKLREQFLIREKELEWENSKRLQQQAKLLAESNAELERFAHLVSHDLQEPLNTMSSYCQLLARVVGDGLDPNAQEYLRFIQEGAKRMKSLVKGLLTYSQMKSESTQLELVDMNGIAEKTIKDLNALIKKASAEVTFSELPTVKGDKLRLSQVILNLVTNAIKFRTQDRVPSVHIWVREADLGWEFCVEDNGIGINQKYLDQIFVMFKRLHTRDLYEGSGVGLAVCKKILESHGGKIWVESEEGKGSKFFFSLPRVEDTVQLPVKSAQAVVLHSN